MPIIVSTMSADVEYATYSKATQGGTPIKTGSILIKGGANIADKLTLKAPVGGMTTVTDEQLKQLEDNPAFARQVLAGFVTISKVKVEVDEAVKDLEKKDGSAQLTYDDFTDTDEDGLVKKPIVNGDNSARSRGRKAN